MGLFSKGLDLSGVSSQAQSELNFSPIEGIGAVILAAIASDGHVSDEECQVACAVISQMQLFKSYSGDVTGRVFSKLNGLFKRHEVATVLSAAKQSIPFELQPTVFAIATDLVLADGVVTEEEENLLEDLYKLLEVSEDTAQKIIDVMIIKNKG